MSLVCRNLSFAYQDRPVLRSVNMEVEKGQCCVLLGRNGSGKSTLIYCLAGLEKPQQGAVTIDGADVHAMGRREIARRVSLVPQEHADIFPFRVLDVVVMGRTAFLPFSRRPAAADYQAAKKVLTDLEAGDLADRSFNRISGGERRIALLARALLQSSDTLLLDEPTNHLDFNNKYRLLARIRNLCRQKGTRVIASLHDPNLAAWFADTVVMLQAGRVLTKGPVDAVMSSQWVSRLYETPTRRMASEEVGAIFVPDHACREDRSNW